MHINLEARDQHAIQAYSDSQIQINSKMYQTSLIVSKQEIISDVAIKSIQDMDQSHLELLLQTKPELIIIGCEETGRFPPMELLSQLSKKRIGVECMSIGAACRTFNVLLSENREVVGFFIVNNSIKPVV